MSDEAILGVFEVGAILGESPVWSPDEQCLWWLDIKAPALHRYDPSNGTDDQWAEQAAEVAEHRMDRERSTASLGLSATGRAGGERR